MNTYIAKRDGGWRIMLTDGSPVWSDDFNGWLFEDSNRFICLPIGVHGVMCLIGRLPRWDDCHNLTLGHTIYHLPYFVDERPDCIAIRHSSMADGEAKDALLCHSLGSVVDFWDGEMEYIKCESCGQQKPGPAKVTDKMREVAHGRCAAYNREVS